MSVSKISHNLPSPSGKLNYLSSQVLTVYHAKVIHCISVEQFRLIKARLSEHQPCLRSVLTYAMFDQHQHDTDHHILYNQFCKSF